MMRPKPKRKARPSEYTCDCSGGVQVYHRTVLDIELQGLCPTFEVYYCKECDKATIWAQDGRHIVTVYGDVPLKLAMKGIPVRPKPPPSVAQRQATTKASSHKGRPPQPLSQKPHKGKHLAPDVFMQVTKRGKTRPYRGGRRRDMYNGIYGAKGDPLHHIKGFQN